MGGHTNPTSREAVLLDHLVRLMQELCRRDRLDAVHTSAVIDLATSPCEIAPVSRTTDLRLGPGSVTRKH